MNVALLHDLHRGHATQASFFIQQERQQDPIQTQRIAPDIRFPAPPHVTNAMRAQTYKVGMIVLRGSPLGHRRHARSESRLSVAVCKPRSTCTNADDAARARTSAGATSPWLAKTQAKTRDDLRKDAIVSREMIRKVACCGMHKGSSYPEGRWHLQHMRADQA